MGRSGLTGAMGAQRRTGWRAGLVVAAAFATAAFGTVNVGRQSGEHEKITRLAVGCSSKWSAKHPCFEPDTLDQLAGRRGTFGAIGYPDSSYAVFQSKAHCDNGDYLALDGYPRTAAQGQAKLEECRAWMERNLAAAVKDAADLLDRKGRIQRREVTLIVGCVWAFNVKGRAKCNVLQDMGIAMHASQDFYAHSNWADRGGGTSVSDPPGLGRSGPAPWIRLKGDAEFPEGLISGCFTVAGSACEGRVTHSTLNKDTGEIRAGAIGPGTTPRGAEADTYRYAVEAAIADTRDKWAVLRARLNEAYGRKRAGRMVCALTRDDPVDDCQDD